MKQAFTALLVLAALLLAPFFTILSAQANLVVTAAGFTPASIDKGDWLSVQATVANTGNVAAPANYLFIYYSQDLPVTADELISRVSVKALAPGESQDIDFQYPVPASLIAGDYYIRLEADPYDQVLETDEENVFCSAENDDCATFQITDSVLASRKIPYPVLFVHGWVSSSDTWNAFTNEADRYYGWTYGGRLDYCLNPDGSQYTSDGYIQPFVNEAELGPGDYYYVNFDISADGDLFVGNDFIPFNNDYSNQSAIVKQGWAIADAVEKVLALSGAEKVVLVGHSMGGLACREYLQNPGNWPADGAHHVAKLLTISTPNGGTNVSAGGVGGLIGFDESSEAVRDVRYPSASFGAQYLFGGPESAFSSFYNNDVDCNGSIGDPIFGLNEKSFPADVHYSFILSPNDLVVDPDRANLNNYLQATPPFASPLADQFTVSSGHTNTHQQNHATLVRGLDEAGDAAIPYAIPLNTRFFAHSGEPAENHPIPPPAGLIDADEFSFAVPEAGILEIEVRNIPVHQFSVALFGGQNQLLQEIQSAGESNMAVALEVSAGTHRLRIQSLPTPNSWRFPYAFSVSFKPGVAPLAHFSAKRQEGCIPFTVDFANQSEGDPGTYYWIFEGGSPGTSTAENPTVTYEQAGIYPVSLVVSNAFGSDTLLQEAYITVRSAPEAAFSFLSEAGHTVIFTNQTPSGIEAPEYLWDFGDGQTSAATSPVHTYENGGVYTVTLTATNACGSSSLTQTIEIVLVANEEIEENSAIAVYPNPNKDHVTISIAGDYAGAVVLSLFNSAGQLIKTEKAWKLADLLAFQLDLSGLPGGVYLVKIKMGDGNEVRRVVKE